MSFFDFRKVNLPNSRLFRFLTFLSTLQNFYASVRLQKPLKLALLKGLQQDWKFENVFQRKKSCKMSFFDFRKVNLPNSRLFRFLTFLSILQNFYASVRLQRPLKLALLQKLHQDWKFENPIQLKKSCKISFFDFRMVNLPNPRIFQFLTFCTQKSISDTGFVLHVIPAVFLQ